ncbi:heavy-metal-associated domain-containing protein [Clostridium sp. D2Q-11]|uniref:Heavy-metal-associated domain-containing protein n=1 Tax=Anaeromonas frigoriresistens TaxID=2683708 RepID=A0A942Z604_9FIRM|nr:cation transporter [Anaeromonas frigoriresistens]MBS4537052.1 heavy-metal-associated domain-containing protein [Anaeromonas frigoriresistens]
MQKTLTIEGMSCGHCTNAVEKSLMNLEEVTKVRADLASKTAEVEGYELKDENLTKAVEEAGYEVVDIKTV